MIEVLNFFLHNSHLTNRFAEHKVPNVKFWQAIRLFVYIIPQKQDKQINASPL